MNQAGRVVIKAGGSLLGHAGGVTRLAGWLDSSAAGRFEQVRVLLVGGGAVADGVRRVDRANPRSDEAAHWGAIRAMELNAHLLAESLPRFTPTDCLQEIVACEGRGDFLMLPLRFLRELEPSHAGERLEVGWSVTSDSIAARLAACLGASLLLIKSSAVPPSGQWRDAVEAGLLDEAFPRYAEGVGQIRVVGLPQTPFGGGA